MKIWLITNLFAPDVHGGAVLYTDMAQWFKARGHDIRVTTTFSYYPAWKLRPEDEGVTLHDEVWHDIPVRRVKIYMPAKLSGSRRMLFDASFFGALLRRGKFRDWAPDAIITAEPMLSQCAALRFLYPRKRIPRLIIVQDFAADAAIELGLLRSAILVKMARAVERWALGSATVLTTISPQMLTKLKAIAPAHIPKHYVPNWIHGSLAQAVARKFAHPPRRAARKLVYSGNLGAKQGLPEFVRLFSSFRHDWTLKIHGAGAAADELRNILAELNDPRVSLGGILEEDAYLDLLMSATACVVTQKSGVGANFLPSKVLPCLATGTPVLAFADAHSPLAKEIISGYFGWVANDKPTLQQALLELSQPAEANERSPNALTWARHYEQETILARHLDLISPSHFP